ncbi:hypothetical protein ACFLZM_05450 [Thermodesulfobacteriota bacterium]
MKTVIALLTPRLRSFKNRAKAKQGRFRYALFAVIGLMFWAGIFAVSYRVLSYFKKVEDLGDILAYKLLSMILLIFFSLLIFSSILTSLSKLYLSSDLKLVHALPVSSEKIFLSRLIESTFDSSWMVIVYAIPVFIAYGRIFQAGLFFYADIVLVLLPMCMIASSVSALLVLLGVMALPATRIRSIFIFLGLLVFIVLYMAFRLSRPERLVDPEAFATVLVYLKQLSAPSPPFLPSTWAFDSLKAALLHDEKTAMFHVAISWSGAVFLVSLVVQTARHLYFKGYSKTQTAMIRFFETQGKTLDRIFSFLSGPIRAIVIKEIKIFWRDQTQWTQIFLVGALIIIYIYNFSVLPLEKAPIATVYLQNLLSFLNMALTAFVLTAVAARFAFPSVSTERHAFWIISSGPISIRSFLWIKFFIYLFPLLILAEALIVSTNLLLRVTPFMMHLSIITLFFMTPGVVSIGVGLGAAYPDFTCENPAQSVTGFGGLIFMILSTAYIGAVTILQAGPVYTVFMSNIRGYTLSTLQWLWLVVSFSIAFFLSILAVILPIRFGEKKLAEICIH